MSGTDPATGDRSGARASVAGAAAAVLIALQGIGLVAAGMFLIVRALEPDAGHRGSTEVLGAMSVLVGAGVIALARSVRARNRRLRSLLLVFEIICLPVAVTSIQGGRWYVGLPLALVAVTVIVLLGVAGLLSPSDD
jgi:hypothetical protein